VGDAQRRSGLGRIKIGVEHALAAAELQLEAARLANLKRRLAEMADELVRSQAEQLARLRRDRLWWWSLLWLRRLLGAHAGGEEQGRSENQSAHGGTMPAVARRRNVAAETSRRYARLNALLREKP
jgi:hypothetical protein